MGTQKALALVFVTLALSLICAGSSPGVEGVEVEPRLSLPAPPIAEVEFPTFLWGLPVGRRPRGVASGVYVEDRGYDLLLWGKGRGAWVDPLFSIRACKGNDVGAYSVGDGTGSLTVSSGAGDVALWGKGYWEKRPLVSLQNEDQVGALWGGGALCDLGSAVYAFRSSIATFGYSLRDGLSPEEWNGHVAGLVADLDVFYGERGVLRATTRVRRECLFTCESTGEVSLAHKTILTPWLHVTPGLVAALHTPKFQPSFEALWLASKRLAACFSYQPGYWAPSWVETYLNQDYFRLNRVPVRQVMERSLKAELRLRLDGLNSLGISLTRKKVENFVFWESDNDNLLIPGNQDVEVREVGGDMRNRVGLFGNRLSFSWRRVTDGAGSVMPYQPQLELREAFHLIPVEGWRLTLGAAYCDERRFRSGAEETLPGYLTSFFEGEAKVGRSLALLIGVDNLADSRYEVFSGRYHRGRNWSGGMKVLLW